MLESLAENTNLRELQLNFYPGNALLGHNPSSFSAWFIFPMDKDVWELIPDHDNLAFIPDTAPFSEKFQVLPGFEEISRIRGLDRVVCSFHPGIPLKALSAQDRFNFEAWINKTLTQQRHSELANATVWDRKHAQPVVD